MFACASESRCLGDSSTVTPLVLRTKINCTSGAAVSHRLRCYNCQHASLCYGICNNSSGLPGSYAPVARPIPTNSFGPPSDAAPNCNPYPDTAALTLAHCCSNAKTASHLFRSFSSRWGIVCERSGQLGGDFSARCQSGKPRSSCRTCQPDRQGFGLCQLPALRHWRAFPGHVAVGLGHDWAPARYLHLEFFHPARWPHLD